MRKKILLLWVMSIFFSWQVWAPASFADNLKENISVTPGKTITTAEEAAMSSAASKVLLHVARARGDIENKKTDPAIAELKQASTLIDIIKASVPTWKVKDQISVATEHLSYEDVDTIREDFIPIYASLDELEALVPVEKTKAHVREAQKNLEKGVKNKVKTELKLADEALTYTEIDLPIQFTEEQVNLAIEYLKKDKPQLADEALSKAEDGVQYMSILVYDPLVGAKKSLYQASKDYANREYLAAKINLQQATAYLEKAVKNGDAKTKQEAKKLARQVAELLSNIEKGGEATGSYLTSLWHKTKALSELGVEKMAMGWQKLRTKSEVQDEVINAKLHTAYARIDLLVLQDSKQAKAEIDKARAYLKKAGLQVDDVTKKEIVEIDTDLKTAGQQMKDGVHDAMLRFSRIEARLKAIIKNIR